MTVSRREEPGGALEAEPLGELLEVFDADGGMVGLRTRGEIHQDPSLIHRSVHVMVFNRRQELFLQKRSMQKMIMPGRWDTSVGGHVDPGESYEEAAAREMEEELGIHLAETSGARLRHLHDYTWRTAVETERVRSFAVAWDGAIRYNPVEIDEGRFWTEQELRDAAGSGLLTTNLEHELRLGGILSG